MNAARHKLKFALARNDSGNWTDEFDDEGVVVLRSTEQTVGGGWRIEAPARLRFIPPLPDDAYLREGDIVITKSSGSALHIGKASLVDSEIAALRCTFSNFMQRLRCKREFSPRLVWYFLNSADGRAELDRASLSTTGLANLNGTVIGNLEVAFPAYDDQLRIAAYLDAATGKIDRLMSLRRRQMELLREQRAALIQQAVTRGLNPRAPLKDSGLPWLGQIPVHWSEPIRLKYVSTLKGRLGWQGLKAEEYRDEGPYVVSSAHFDNFRILWDQCPRVTQERYELDANIQLREGDLLLMKDGAALGKLAFVDTLPGPACLNSHLLLLRPIQIDGEPSYEPQFLFSLMQTSLFQEQIKISATGTTFFGVSQEAIGELRVALPPLDEQREILAFIQRETAKLDGLHRSYERQLALLAEYRASLIHECVTGQRPVPN